MKREVDKQVASPAVARTPNLHRAKNRSLRVRMEGWRQWRLGRGEKPCPTKKQKNPLDSDRPSHERPLHSRPRLVSCWTPSAQLLVRLLQLQKHLPKSLLPNQACGG